MEFQSGTPIYTQVIDSLREKMVTGELSPGDKLPSSRELAKEYRINPNTAARVYSETDLLGLTFTKRGIGTFVTEDEKMVSSLKQELTGKLVAEFTEKMARLGVSPSELPGILKDSLKK